MPTGEGQVYGQTDPASKERTDTTLSRAEAIYEEVEAEEAHPLELFYDLFFVANLTTITSVHAMTDHESERSSSSSTK